MTKVVFLDFDGPMVPARAEFLQKRKEFDVFDPCAVAMLNNIIEITGTKLVISSTFGSRGYEKTLQVFHENGIDPGHLHADWVTERDPYRERADQIEHWIDQHPEVRRYAVLDDWDMTETFGEHMVLVSYNEGMLTGHRMKMIELLGRKENDELFNHLHSLGAK